MIYGMFEEDDEVMSAQEIAHYAARYKALAGFDRVTLNSRAPLISVCDIRNTADA